MGKDFNNNRRFNNGKGDNTNNNGSKRKPRNNRRKPGSGTAPETVPEQSSDVKWMHTDRAAVVDKEISNDVTYYNINPEAFDRVTKVKRPALAMNPVEFSSVTGDGTAYSVKGRDTTPFLLVYNTDFVPGYIADDLVNPIDTVLSGLYSTMRRLKSNTGATYMPADLGMYFQAVDILTSGWVECARYLRIARMPMDPTTGVTGFQLYKGATGDSDTYQSFMADFDVYAARLETLRVAINRWLLPDWYKPVSRHVSMLTGFYTDTQWVDHKFFAFTLGKLRMWDDTTSPQGTSLQPVAWGSNFASRLSALNVCLNALESSSGALNIRADLTAAFSESSFKSLPPVDYSVMPVGYDDIINMQVENMMVTEGYTAGAVTQDVTHNHLTTTSTYLPGDVKAIAKCRLNFHSDTITQEMLCEATRLTTLWQVVVPLEGIPFLVPTHGTELVYSIYLVGISGTSPHGITTRSRVYQLFRSNSSPAIPSSQILTSRVTLNTEYKLLLAALEDFNVLPPLWMVVNSTVDGEDVYEFNGYLTNRDVVATMSYDMLREMNQVYLASEWGAYGNLFPSNT